MTIWDACPCGRCEGPHRRDWPMVENPVENVLASASRGPKSDQYGDYFGEPDGVFAWKTVGKCRGIDPNLFFPERGDPTAEAKRICSECRVREKCLEFALQSGERHGIWGGKSERERRRIRRERKVESGAMVAEFDPETDDALDVMVGVLESLVETVSA